MTAGEVRALVRSQVGEAGAMANDHRITLEESLVPPVEITLILQRVSKGRIMETKLRGWLVGREPGEDGYLIVMDDRGEEFGLATKRHTAGEPLVLCGWYGSLISAFLSM